MGEDSTENLFKALDEELKLEEEMKKSTAELLRRSHAELDAGKRAIEKSRDFRTRIAEIVATYPEQPNDINQQSVALDILDRVRNFCANRKQSSSNRTPPRDPKTFSDVPSNTIPMVDNGSGVEPNRSNIETGIDEDLDRNRRAGTHDSLYADPYSPIVGEEQFEQSRIAHGEMAGSQSNADGNGNAMENDHEAGK